MSSALSLRRGPGRSAGLSRCFPRAVSVVCLVGVWFLLPIAAVVLCLIVGGLAVFEAWRMSSWTPTVIVGVAFALLGVPLGALAGFGIAQTGVLMMVAATVVAGLHGGVAGPRRIPLIAAAATLATVGMFSAWVLPETAAPALMLLGATIGLFATTADNRAGMGVGAVAIVIGSWLQLAVWNVEWLEAYLALPALAALYAGSRWHRSGVSSWIAYAPTIALFGAVAAFDRFDGGSAWHAVIAGGVGVLAVLAGGWYRLVGPLLTGTALVAAVTIYESLGPGSRVPTWGWLALGGAVLLGAAVYMERAETTPLEQGQRVLAVLTTRFS